MLDTVTQRHNLAKNSILVPLKETELTVSSSMDMVTLNCPQCHPRSQTPSERPYTNDNNANNIADIIGVDKNNSNNSTINS